jgi:hypothetical protein
MNTLQPTMTLHIFNPGHDIALAANIENFTVPHAARQLHHDLGFLPSLWASPGDMVLVDDPEAAIESLRRMAISAKRYLGLVVNERIDFSPVVSHSTEVDPWGWNLALRARLRRQGVVSDIMPNDRQLQDIRNLSHRRTAAQMLRILIDDPALLPVECTTLDEVTASIGRFGRAVIKAPWSSSGRGIRFVSDESKVTGDEPETHHLRGWLHNVLERQGSVMVEPYYDKVKDFGMEFIAMADGSVEYCGLSLFHTANGAYTGNILATENSKREMLGRYISLDAIDQAKETICHHLADIVQDRYQGPLGVDMMVVSKNNNLALHPCVEINLRRTMGHAALALTPDDDDLMGVMRIEYSNSHYKLSLNRL